ncbi:hypothetical protein Patl1_22423 [Pistacia atlantica]|uniref:Uncharacterized protein n=1 Tax=Pistacia atlantica TaxID=434234 RepID=A0ACC0ZZF6_9ROSI|nr:hypothetical protein Patl1_22423 [Pistacia atlantica]
MLSGDPLVEQSCQAVVNENQFFPSKTSLTMSEDCEEMLPSEKTEESLIELWKQLPSALAEMENRKNRWYEYERERERELSDEGPFVEQSCQAVVNENGYVSSEDPLVEQSCQAVVNENGHKFNMTEGRLRSEARKGKAKAKAALSGQNPLISKLQRPPLRQMMSMQILRPGGSSSTAQNEPPPNYRGLPVVGDHQADDDPAKHTNLETGGGSSTAQNEPHTNPEIRRGLLDCTK